MSETIELQGRAWQARELEQIRQWVAENPTWSRYRLSRELCVGWNWVRPNGQLADMAARSFLNKLHARALIQFVVPVATPGTELTTSATDFRVFSQLQLSRFNGTNFEPFGEVLSAD